MHPETATIHYVPSKVGVRTLIESVEDTGYGASVKAASGGEAEEMRLRKEREIKKWRVRFFGSLLALLAPCSVFITRTLIESVEDAGNGVAVKAASGGEAEEMRLRKEREIKKWRVRFGFFFWTIYCGRR